MQNILYFVFLNTLCTANVTNDRIEKSTLPQSDILCTHNINDY